MYGPISPDHWSSTEAPNGGTKSYRHLVPGGFYTVVKPFTDYDGDDHKVGETWIYRGYSFSPHDDGLSLFVSMSATDEWQIRLQWRPDQQAEILDNLSEFIHEAMKGPGK